MFNNTFNYKVIYVFKIYDELHKGILKVGESTLKSNIEKEKLTDNCELLNQSARDRIRSYTNTIGVQEELLYTTLAIDNNNKVFKDKNVHKVLKNSGIKKHDFKNKKNPEEWFETNLETVINAINAVKEGRKTLNRTEVDEEYEDIEFRPEQIEAIEKTLKRFEVSDKMLWNAKMRFGKTLSTLEVIKRMSKSKSYNLSKAIILTHRPVVDEGWFEDYKKIFYNDDNFLYGSKKRTNISELIKSGKNFIYFASMQDLRESNRIGGIYLKNDDVFEVDWDLIVIDEAHEGTQTELGKKVVEELLKSDSNHNAKQLHLSGTPFNILSDFESNDIYTWDYIMEQKAKLDWENNHPLEPNPYDELPKLNILTYNLEDFLPNYIEVADKAFNFREFFRVWTGETEKDGKEIPNENLIGKFIHEEDVKKFLYLLTHEDENNNYPFSKQIYRDNFRHSFWILPGVKEAKALKDLMLQDQAFSMFDIVNVAGTGDNNGDEALDAVHKAIGETPEDTYTITLSCGKLTTGVTVKEWSAVLYLAGSFSTAASSYLQTIFRVQSPCNYGGKQKTDCYVFDFAPDRTLKMVAQAGELSIKAGSTGSKETMKEFLNFCPVISVEGSEMKPYNVSTMLQQLKQAYVERVVDNGFDDVKIYNDNLYKLDENALKKFENLKGIIGATKQKQKINEIGVNNQGFNEEQWAEIEKIKKIPKAELTDEQKQLLEEIKEKNKQKNDAISILRGISIRIPLLIYGADITDEEDITINNFTDIIDDLSWKEFMPQGVTKEMFKDFSQYYDNEIFIGAGRRIRNIAKHADTMNPIERAISIADIFSTFRNPDKETVLTPWKTVNRHMGDTIGGCNFFDDKYINQLNEPRYINNGDITHDLLVNTDSKILELNSKTGLYPLYVAISLFNQRCLNIDSKKLTEEVVKQLWEKTIEENIFVICKTPMAKSITRRTLVGYKNVKTNIINYENIAKLLSEEFEKIENEIRNPASWGKIGSEKMKFDAIIGNPPYQELLANYNGTVSQANPIYNIFVESATKLTERYVSMITPSLWMTGGTGLNDFRKYMLTENHITILHDYEVSDKIFSNVNIAGGVSYFLWDKNVTGKTKHYYYKKDLEPTITTVNMASNGTDIFIRDVVAENVLKKVGSFEENFKSFIDVVSTNSPFTKGVAGVFKNDEYSSPKSNSVKIYRFSRNSRSNFAYIDRDKVKIREEWIDAHKVFVSKAGEISAKFNGLPFYGEPNSICSETYMVVGPFETKEICGNVIKYMNTSLYKYLIAQIKKTQNAARGVYKYVPMQDFTDFSDIDWNQPLKDIDKQIFEKYKLTDEEIDYILSTVQ